MFTLDTIFIIAYLILIVISRDVNKKLRDDKDEAETRRVYTFILISIIVYLPSVKTGHVIQSQLT